MILPITAASGSFYITAGYLLGASGSLEPSALVKVEGENGEEIKGGVGILFNRNPPLDLKGIIGITDELRWGGIPHFAGLGDYDHTSMQLGTYYCILNATSSGTYHIVIPEMSESGVIAENTWKNEKKLSLEVPYPGVHMFAVPYEFDGSEMLIGERAYKLGPMEQNLLGVFGGCAQYKQVPVDPGEYTSEGVYLKKVPYYEQKAASAGLSKIQFYGKCPPGTKEVYLSSYCGRDDKASLLESKLASTTNVYSNGLFWMNVEDDNIPLHCTASAGEIDLLSGVMSADVIYADTGHVICADGYVYRVSHADTSDNILDSGYRVVSSKNFASSITAKHHNWYYVAVGAKLYYISISGDSNTATSATWKTNWSYTLPANIDVVDGNVVACADNVIYALKNNYSSTSTSISWTYAGHTSKINDLRYFDGKYFSVSDDGTTRCINAGTEEWVYTHPCAARALLAGDSSYFSDDEYFIYVGLENGTIDVLSSSGILQDSFSSGFDMVKGMCSLYGSIFVFGENGYVRCIRRNGSHAFTIETGFDRIDNVWLYEDHPSRTTIGQLSLAVCSGPNIVYYGVDTMLSGDYLGAVWCEAPTGGEIFANVTLHTYCLSGDTLITMADLSHRRMDELVVGDSVLDRTGTPTTVVKLERGNYSNRHILYYFNDGTVIDETHEHRFYNVERDTLIKLKDWNIGDHARKKDGSTTSLLSVEVVDEPAEMFGLWTESGYYFANGLLSGDISGAFSESLNNDKFEELFYSIPEDKIRYILGEQGWFE